MEAVAATIHPSLQIDTADLLLYDFQYLMEAEALQESEGASSASAPHRLINSKL